MTCTLIDGKAFANTIEQDLTRAVQYLTQQKGNIPHLSLIHIGDFEDNRRYVSLKHKRATALGMRATITHLPHHTQHNEVIKLIQTHNKDPHIHGILLQLPVPDHLKDFQLEEHITHDKEVDGLSHGHRARLITNEQPFFAPPTPLGCMWLLHHFHPRPLKGENILVIGRSNLVGRPMAELLINAHATVTIAHRYTKNLKELASKADIIISAAGHPDLLFAKDIKSGATILDVGITGVTDNTGAFKIKGDMADNMKEKAGYLTPVPGGVGPLTITGLLFNTIKAAYLQQHIPMPEELKKWDDLSQK